MNVALVNMPFAAVRPAIGPSLLKAHLAGMGCPARVIYLNTRFAGRLGPAEFAYVADRSPTQSLAGDWVFAQALHGTRADADAAYLREFRDRFGNYLDASAPIATLRRARELAGEFIEECAADPGWADYDVIGFTSTFTQHVASLALARRIKQRHPQAVIAFGGANCEDAMGLAVHRTFPFVDYVCSGEADISFPRLVDALRTGEDPALIPGVIARRDGATTYQSLTPQRVRDLDVLPVPDYRDFFDQLEPGARSRATVLMETSRGCWWGEKHHCTFCGLNGTAMTYRSKSAPRVLAEIDSLVSDYGPATIEMVDNILDMTYFQDLLPALRDRGSRLGLFYETKANLSRQRIEELHAAGVTSIQPGIESFSTAVLALMRKGTTALQNIQLLKWCREVGITVYWNLLYGFPGEEPDDYERMANLIDDLTHLDPPQGMGSIRLDRFSPNFVEAATLGLVNVRPDRSYRLIYDLPEPELSALAYYFEHDYLDGRQPKDYVATTEQAMRRWYEQAGGRGLVYVDHGETLAIWDFRAVARQRLTVLTGPERELYLFCDAHRSLRSITGRAAELGIPAERAASVVARLTGLRVMIGVDGRYLSLAVRTAALPAPDPSDRRTAELVF